MIQVKIKLKKQRKKAVRVKKIKVEPFVEVISSASVLLHGEEGTSVTGKKRIREK